MRFTVKNLRRGMKRQSARKSAEIRQAAWQVVEKQGESRQALAQSLESRTFLAGTPIPIVNPGFETLYEPGTDVVEPDGAFGAGASTQTVVALPGQAGTFDANPFGPDSQLRYQLSMDPQNLNTKTPGGYDVATVQYSDGTSGNYADVAGWSAPTFPATYGGVVNVAPQINTKGQDSYEPFPGKTDNVLYLNGPGSTKGGTTVATGAYDTGPAYQTVSQQLGTDVQPNTLYTLSVQVGLPEDDSPTNLAIPIIANVEVNGTPLTLVSSNYNQVVNEIEVKPNHADSTLQSGLAFDLLPAAVQAGLTALAQGTSLATKTFGEYTENGQTFYGATISIEGSDNKSASANIAVDPDGNPIGPGTFQTLTETFYAGSAIASNAPLTIVLGTGPQSTGQSLQTDFDNVQLAQAPATPSPVVTGTFVSAPDITAPTTSTETVTVNYSSIAGAINTSTISSSNLIVVGPSGNALPSALVSSSFVASASGATATYSIAAPEGGDFSDADNGTYTLLIAPGSVMDASGNAVGFVSPAAFTVNVSAPPSTLDFTSEAVVTPASGATVIVGHIGDPFGAGSNSQAALEIMPSGDTSPPAPIFPFGAATNSAFLGAAVVPQGLPNAGNIVAVGTENGDMMVACFNPAGSLDTSFGNAGVFLAGINGDSAAYSVAIDPTGKIVVGGTNSNGDYVLFRLNANGTPDITFDPKGENDSAQSFGLTASALLPLQGKFLTAGGGELRVTGGQGGNAIDQIVLQPSSSGYNILAAASASAIVGGSAPVASKVVAVLDVSSAGAANTSFGLVGTASASTANDTQFLDTGHATGGTFTLTFMGQTTTSLAAGATALDVQNALNKLPDVMSAGSVAVSTSDNDRYTITFPPNDVSGTATNKVPQITLNSPPMTGLTGTSSTPVLGVPSGVPNLLNEFQPVPGLALVSGLIPEALGSDAAKSPVGIAIQSDGNMVVVAGANDSTPVTGAAETGTTVTITAQNDFAVGQQVTIAGVVPTSYDGTFTITAVGANGASFSFTTAAGLSTKNFNFTDATASITDFGVARLLANGQLDPSFGTAGVTMTQFPSGTAYANSVSITTPTGPTGPASTESIFVSGVSYGTAGFESAFADYSSTGALVPLPMQSGSLPNGTVVLASGLSVSRSYYSGNGAPGETLGSINGDGSVTVITSDPNNGGDSTTRRIQFVSPLPQLAVYDTTATTNTNTTTFDVVYTAPAGDEVDATTIDPTLTATDVTNPQLKLQVPVTATLSGVITATGTFIPEGMGTSAQDAQTVDAVYTLSPGSLNWTTTDDGTVHVQLNTQVNDTTGAALDKVTGDEFGNFQLEVQSLGSQLKLGSVTGNLPTSVAGQTRFSSPLQVVVTNVYQVNGTPTAFDQPVALTLYTSPDDTLNNAVKQHTVIRRLNLAASGPGASETLSIAGLTWPSVPGDYYVLAFISTPGSKATAGMPLSENIGTTAATIHVTQPIFDLATMSATLSSPTLVNGMNMMYAMVENVGNVAATGGGMISISIANDMSSKSVKIPFTANLAVGKTVRVRIPFHGKTLAASGPVKLLVNIALDQDVNSQNNSAITPVVSSD